MTDAKYFQTTKKGEIHELKEELMNPKLDKKKEAVKKVIAAMTVGKDVSMLFTDVVNCMQTANLEIKKLVYLYLMNYAKSNPDLAILAVNTFVKDSSDPNPLIRALAIRTMACIRVERITEYLCDPLLKGLKDDDPYVRKTAAVAVAKMWDINPTLTSSAGFLAALNNCLSDANPMVVANSVAALCEIQDSLGPNEDVIFKINASHLHKLLAALNECTEWGQIFLLDALSSYVPSSAMEAESIAERVMPRMSHTNAAVVLSAVRVLMVCLDVMDGEGGSRSSAEKTKALCNKMTPPLVTLLSSEPEVQYVALRNIALILQKRPMILAHEVKVFFCKYNDPIYVKMEKLDILVRLCNDRNLDSVLMEFKEYASEVDVDFVRKSVRAIGRCAIKLSSATTKCMDVLLDLIQTRVNYVVQEAMVVIKDIFRRYPNQYESIISTLCENLDSLDEPEAKASMIWILGEYAGRIENAHDLLQLFVESFSDETSMVQLQLLTAAVKLFLLRGGEDESTLLYRILSLCTEDSDNPDLRDRGYVYWRLLSTDPEATRRVVMDEKPVIADDTNSLDPSVLDDLLRHVGSLVSVYHKPPETFVPRAKTTTGERPKEKEREKEKEKGKAEEANKTAARTPKEPINLLDGDSTTSSPSVTLPEPSFKVVLTEAQGKGLEVSTRMLLSDGIMIYQMQFRNHSQMPLTEFALQFNKNSHQLEPVDKRLSLGTVAPGAQQSCSVTMVSNPVYAKEGPFTSTLQVALKTQLGVLYFADELSLHVALKEGGTLDKNTYISSWKAVPDTDERVFTIKNVSQLSSSAVMQDRLQASRIYFIAKRTVENVEAYFFSAITLHGIVLLLELKCATPWNGSAIRCTLRCADVSYAPCVEKSLRFILEDQNTAAPSPAPEMALLDLL